KIDSIDEAKSLHGLSITTGTTPGRQLVFLRNRIISSYTNFGELSMARKVFDEMPVRNVVSYNSMISCYSRGDVSSNEAALKLFREMRILGFKSSQFTLGSLLSCECLDIFSSMQLHGLIEKSGMLYLDAYSGTALMGTYARIGCLDEALQVFETMPVKNLVTFNTAISLFGKMDFIQDCIFMLAEVMNSMVVSECTFVNILSALGESHLQLGEQIHCVVIKFGFDGTVSVSNCLISMYGKASPGSSLAEKMFEAASVKDTVSWNTLISAMACHGDEPKKILDTFTKMGMSGFSPNATTLSNALKSCSELESLSRGESIHSMAIKKNLDCEVYTGSSLVNFYSKYRKVEEAQACFDGISHKNSVSWNALMAGYSNGDAYFCVKLFQEMVHSGFHPNEVSFSTVIKSVSTEDLLQLHPVAIKMGYEANPYVLSSLIVSYSRNGLVADALRFVGSSIDDHETIPVASRNIIAGIYNRTGQYDKTQELYAEMKNPDAISWNVLIAACSRNGDYRETFELFDHMLRSRIPPDEYTFVSLFSICTELCDLPLGKSLHAFILKTNFDRCDTFLRNVIIDMYGKCGSVHGSMKVFDEAKHKNVMSWTALVSALGLNGYGNEALEKFRDMVAMGGMKPDRVAVLAVLSGCRHSGLVKEGMDLFYGMRTEFGIEADPDHYVVVVDMLTRSGLIKEAEKLILGMGFAPNASIWRSFLEGCNKF
ncbi:hypothetical protein M569_02835, partial [Genlisea aurea]